MSHQGIVELSWKGHELQLVQIAGIPRVSDADLGSARHSL